MSDRGLLGAAVSLAVVLAAAQAFMKPGFDPVDARRVARTFDGGSEWRGRPAGDFELTLRDGTPFRLSDHIGREVVVLNFFATWCAPCLAEMPELQHFVDRMARERRPVAFLAIDAQEPAGRVDEFARRASLALPVAIDVTGRVGARYGVDAWPTTVVIGADGVIELYQTGAISNADVTLAPVVAADFARLAAGHETAESLRKEWAGATKRPAPREGWTPPDAGSALTGRALAIAEAMPCPCGCDEKVIACTCQTANAIKASLKAGVDAALSDADVMRRLDKQFCMKGM